MQCLFFAITVPLSPAMLLLIIKVKSLSLHDFTFLKI